MGTFEIKTEKFSGPLEKLLELIEGKKMEITEFSLAEVTDDFLKYISKLKTLEEEGMERIISDFIVVAAKMILIKSKAILPQIEFTEEETEDIRDLEERLKIYKEIKEASKNVLFSWQKKERSFGRELFLNRPPVFLPPKKEFNLKEAIGLITKVITRIKKEISVEEVKREKVVSIKEKMEELLKRVGNIQKLSVNSLRKKGDKKEIIAFFLAILHLLRDKLIEIEQKENFSDIIITNGK